MATCRYPQISMRLRFPSFYASTLASMWAPWRDKQESLDSDTWVAIDKNTNQVIASDKTYIGLKAKASGENLMYIKDTGEGDFYN